MVYAISMQHYNKICKCCIFLKFSKVLLKFSQSFINFKISYFSYIRMNGVRRKNELLFTVFFRKI